MKTAGRFFNVKHDANNVEISPDKLVKYFDKHLTYNKNPDHLKYSRFYTQIGMKKIRGIVFRKKILVTTAGVKEFIHAFVLKYFFLNTVVHSIHDWEPHPGKHHKVTLIYNKISAILFDLSFYSNYQADKYGKRAMVHYLPITKLNKSEERHKTILLLGRNQKYKNFGFAKKIVKYANASGYKIRIISNNYPLACSDNIEVINDFLSDEKLEKQISEAQLVLLPYTQATQSGVIVNSYECGTPVCVSNIGGLIEYVPNEALGLVINIDDDAKENWNAIEQFLSKWDENEFQRQVKSLGFFGKKI